MKKKSRILVVGHNDIIENSLFSHLEDEGHAVFSFSRMNMDITRQSDIERFFAHEDLEYVFLSSTRSGGIEANQKSPAEFLYHNLISQTNVIHAAYKNRVKKLLYLASSCVYPAKSPQPIKEESFLTGPLEPTSEAYALAKIAGIKMCQAYRAQYKFNAIVMVPPTIYGPGSNLDLATAHVMGALMGKFLKAVKEDEKEVVIWGSGKPKREFLFVDDFVSACLFLMENYDGADIMNVGMGVDVSISQLADMIAKITGFKGKIVIDTSKPDGVMQKLLDNTRITNLGWKPSVGIKEGIEKTYNWYLKRNGVKS